uniref:Uncharacterized protein n=1 Tax=Arundo donax TaxID=35708 RepID=A0A0A9DGI3_ARUDO
MYTAAATAATAETWNVVETGRKRLLWCRRRSRRCRRRRTRRRPPPSASRVPCQPRMQGRGTACCLRKPSPSGSWLRSRRRSTPWTGRTPGCPVERWTQPLGAQATPSGRICRTGCPPPESSQERPGQ